MARNPSFVQTTLEEDFKALGIGVPQKRRIVEGGVPPWMPVEDDEPEPTDAESDDADADDAPPPVPTERKNRREAVLPPENGPKHPSLGAGVGAGDADEDDDADADDAAPPAKESKKNRLERLKQSLSQAMAAPQDGEPQPEEGDDADADDMPTEDAVPDPDGVPGTAEDDDADADDMPPHDEDDAPMPPPPPVAGKKKTEAGEKTKPGTSQQRKKWRDYGKKHKAQRHAYAKTHAKKAQQHRSKVSKVRHGAAAKGKRIYTGMDRISNLIEDVEALVGTFREQKLTESIKSFANLALISDSLSRGFRALSTKLEDKDLLPVARNFAEMADDAAAVAGDLDAVKKGEADAEEPHLDDDEVEEAFRQMMAMMLDGVDLYDNMAPPEWQVPGEEGDDADADVEAGAAEDDDADADDMPPHDEDDTLGVATKPTVGEPGYEKPESKGRKENAPPPASPMPGKLAADADDADADDMPHDEDDVPMPPAKKPGLGKAESDPGAVGAASKKPGKDREEDDDEDPKMPTEAARHTRIKEMKALLGKGAARKTA